MDLGLTSKRALVLSSSRGLGLSVAQAIAAEGADVVMTGRDGDKLKSEVDAINAQGAGTAYGIVADLSDPATPKTLVAQSREKLGGIDILVNNTGGPPPGAMYQADVDVVRKQYEVMVLRVMELAGLVIPEMRERQWGRVLTIASSGVIQPIPNLGLSNAIRASLVGWSKSMANELSGEGLTFNMLLPGRIETDRLKQLDAANAERTGRDVAAVSEAAKADIPAGRYGRTDEFGSVGAFLVSERASYISGSQIRCDGGAIRSV
ncbi:SDR family oxidoreductase [Pseudohoeflea suaedae]|uniref:SDR family oxidoreductase n=1 Tax=Pseudohoeflea suaedae TaxID=877384 RepID=A0A4R5PNL6_9HYPH|nr:SDR family oxidoreductase [Pseudohoeflea suaedae]TDH38157.1 SDR family oxidoreductase [Pseudohoeflea suaedae]